VLCRRASRRTQRRPQHHWYFPRSARHVMYFRRLVHHLVHRQRQKIAEHDVDHRPHSRHRRANTHSRESRLRNRRVNHALRAEFFHQAGKHLERRSRLGHILAKNAHSRVAPHFFRERFSNCLCERQFPRSRVRHTRPGLLRRCSDMAPQWRIPPPPSSQLAPHLECARRHWHPPTFPLTATPESS